MLLLLPLIATLFIQSTTAGLPARLVAQMKHLQKNSCIQQYCGKEAEL
jgi:hypothetical protein